MKYIDILNKMYSVQEYSVKGIETTFKDKFIYSFEENPYIVFIAERISLTGEIKDYKYALYSVKDKTAIIPKSVIYEKITSFFPLLNNLTRKGSRLDFVKKLKLTKEIENILELYSDKYLLNESEMERYHMCLKEMKTIISPSFAEIYEFFEIRK